MANSVAVTSTLIRTGHEINEPASFIHNEIQVLKVKHYVSYTNFLILTHIIDFCC